MAAIITLTTDFGLTDVYVAAMKGVILGINPEARLVDICHTIRPHRILQAAFVLSTAYLFFPPGTIHLVVVDPGVGTERRAIILKTPSASLVAPDNGVLSYIVEQFAAPETGNRLPSALSAVAITNPRFWRSPVSPTFHGRDIFAPVAAWLSRGYPPTDFGETITSVVTLPLVYPRRTKDGGLVGNIIHIDNFGNLITSIRSADLPPATQSITIEINNQRIHGLSRTYAEGNGLLALIGSSGYLEIALKESNSSTFLGATIGNEVRVRQGVDNELSRLQ